MSITESSSIEYNLRFFFDLLMVIFDFSISNDGHLFQQRRDKLNQCLIIKDIFEWKYKKKKKRIYLNIDVIFFGWLWLMSVDFWSAGWEFNLTLFSSAVCKSWICKYKCNITSIIHLSWLLNDKFIFIIVLLYYIPAFLMYLLFSDNWIFLFRISF